VRLCKGAYKEPESVAFQSRLEVDRSYVRCLSALMGGGGYPMIATHDPRLIAIGEDRARWFDRSTDEFEFQLLFGVRPDEQTRLADLGFTVRVYLPYGTEWYGYMMRRMAERPANSAFFVRALLSRR
jgi:proline dehydrogenase